MNGFLVNYDVFWMEKAIYLAGKALNLGEVPVGSVLVFDNIELSSGFNSSFNYSDPLGHAEINVLRKVINDFSHYRLYNTTLYVTLEPCLMCFGLILRTKIKRVVFGSYSIKNISMVKLIYIFKENNISINIEYTAGVLEDESNILLKTFFNNKR